MSIGDMVRIAVQRDYPVPSGLSRAGTDTSRPRWDGLNLGDTIAQEKKGPEYSLWVDTPVGKASGYSAWKDALSAAGRLSKGVNQSAVAVLSDVVDGKGGKPREQFYLQRVATVSDPTITWPTAVPYNIGTVGDRDVRLNWKDHPEIETIVDGDVGIVPDGRPGWTAKPKQQ